MKLLVLSGPNLDRLGTREPHIYGHTTLPQIHDGSYTHTSYALHDAIKGSPLPVVEVHISNPEAREAFRHVSVIAAACVAKVAGFGPDSYRTALEALVRRLTG